MPVIAVSCASRIPDSYRSALLSSGATPLEVAAAGSRGAWAAAHPEETLRGADGLLLTGGGDVDPVRYGGGAPHPAARIDAERDRVEVALCRAAMRRDLPLLGICRGIQVWNVAAGGTLWQDLPSERPSDICHMEDAATRDRRRLLHPVQVLEGAPESERLRGGGPLHVNSIHHQGVRDVAPGLRVVAIAPDGLVEALAAPGLRFAVAVQWHPEELCSAGDDPRHRALFDALCAAAATRGPW